MEQPKEDPASVSAGSQSPESVLEDENHLISSPAQTEAIVVTDSPQSPEPNLEDENQLISSPAQTETTFGSDSSQSPEPVLEDDNQLISSPAQTEAIVVTDSPQSPEPNLDDENQLISSPARTEAIVVTDSPRSTDRALEEMEQSDAQLTMEEFITLSSSENSLYHSIEEDNNLTISPPKELHSSPANGFAEPLATVTNLSSASYNESEAENSPGDTIHQCTPDVQKLGTNVDDNILTKMETTSVKREMLGPGGDDMRKVGAMTEPVNVGQGKASKEDETLRNCVNLDMAVDSHKLRLLADFPRQWGLCKVTMLEREGKVFFFGLKNDCEEARFQFLVAMQGLVEESLELEKSLAKLLTSTKGRARFESFLHKFPQCSAQILNSYLVLAAKQEDALVTLQEEFHQSFTSKSCEVPSTLQSKPQFTSLILELEAGLPVNLTPSLSQSKHTVIVQGFTTDVEEAALKINDFIKRNRTNDHVFHIEGILQSKACQAWLHEDLEGVKQLIRQNGEVKQESFGDVYRLKFQCRHCILPAVTKRLETIRGNIATRFVDLTKEFPFVNEHALLVNGLHAVKVGTFCSAVRETLHQRGMTCVMDFDLPAKYSLHRFSLGAQRGHESSRPASAGSRGKRGSHGHQASASAAVNFPISVDIGKTTIRLKVGDITKEQVDAAVSILGHDLKPTGTAVNSVFHKECPSLASQPGVEIPITGIRDACADCRLLQRDVPAGSRLQMSSVFQVVLGRLPDDKVSGVVYNLVDHVLKTCKGRNFKSVGFPALGVGRRFRYKSRTVAHAMMDSILTLVHNKPYDLQNINVVLHDMHIASDFSWALTKLQKKFGFSLVFEKEEAATTDAEEDDSPSEVEHQDPVEISSQPFKVNLCFPKHVNGSKIAEVILRELRTTFLHMNTLNDVESFRGLGDQVIAQLSSLAGEHNILLTMPGKVLQLCGVKEGVNYIKAMIYERLHGHTSQERSSARVPFPPYWKVCQQERGGMVSYDKALKAWAALVKTDSCLMSVSEEEKQAVTKLVQDTWDVSKAGAGKDARNLSHSAVQVTDVHRLENPSLWKHYMTAREELQHLLVSLTLDTLPSLDQLQGSRGPVLTTASTPRGSPLRRAMCHQVNEHYLFHGTKTGLLKRIWSQGLDPKEASDVTMLGKGTYFAESSTKADQYADPKTGRSQSGAELTMILARVLLGQPYLHKDPNPKTKYNRPPCMSCLNSRGNKCACPASSRQFDSIVDDSSRIFREFVVYDGKLNSYPEYFITYQRL